MQNPQVTVNMIRELLNAQTHDIAWLFEASKFLSVDVKYLEVDGWDSKFWREHWGTIERGTMRDGGTPFTCWVRPDGAPAVANLENTDNVRLVQFALLAEMIKALEQMDKLSYAEAGKTSRWNRAKVTCNGMPLQGVLWADALFGKAEVILRGQGGKLMRRGDQVATRLVTGIVDIAVEKENLTFF